MKGEDGIIMRERGVIKEDHRYGGKVRGRCTREGWKKLRGKERGEEKLARHIGEG